MSGKDNQHYWLDIALDCCTNYGVSKQVIQRFITMLERKEVTKDE